MSIEYIYYYTLIIFNLGPKFPLFNLKNFDSGKLITSPTGKGVVLLGNFSNHMLFMELTGNSKTSLRWNIIDRDLDISCPNKIVIPITDIAWIKLTEEYWFQYKVHQFQSVFHKIFAFFSSFY